MSTAAKRKRRSRYATSRQPKPGAASARAPTKPAGNWASAAKPGIRRQGTKLACLISLLSRAEGATIADLTKAIGWQAHSIRGAISGTLKKKLGLTVTSESIEKRGRVYRIVGRG